MPGVQTTHHMNKKEALKLATELIAAVNTFREGEDGEHGDCVCMVSYSYDRNTPSAFYKLHGSM